MELTPTQDHALQAVKQWLKSDKQVFRLFGYAGTGKTTLAKYFAEGISGTVLFGAFTGKAAHVLASKGCPNVSTIHRMIYIVQSEATEETIKHLQNLIQKERLKEKPCEKSIRLWRLHLEKEQEGNVSFRINPDSPVTDAKLIIIDECSMVNENMGLDLLSFGTKVLVLGDPAQLPPVKGGGYFTNQKPDIMLTEVHRQAKDNPILALATAVREGREIKVGDWGDMVRERSQISAEDILNADQVLVGRNVTRRNYNARIRELKKLSGAVPLAGEKLVCLRNNHELGLLNGAQFITTADSTMLTSAFVRLYVSDGENNLSIEAHQAIFEGRDNQLDWWERKEAEEFDFGYALTVHKSQGSQWDTVVLFDEWDRPETRQQWLYTGITRAAKKLILVKM